MTILMVVLFSNLVLITIGALLQLKIFNILKDLSNKERVTFNYFQFLFMGIGLGVIFFLMNVIVGVLKLNLF